MFDQELSPEHALLARLGVPSFSPLKTRKKDPMVPLIALRQFPFAGKTLVIGRTFRATEPHAKLLKALKWAQDDPAGSFVATPIVEPQLESPPEYRGQVDSSFTPSFQSRLNKRNRVGSRRRRD